MAVKNRKNFLFLLLCSNIVLGLDTYIPPEILKDSFYFKIIDLSANPDVRNILEIGSSCGEAQHQYSQQAYQRIPADLSYIV
jgi:hypothetical protein